VQQSRAWSERNGLGKTVTAIVLVSLVTVLLLSREIETVAGTRWVFVGLAYSTLRHLHVLAEWRFGRISAPGLGAYFRYHMLLPVLIAGPIHRLPHFERQCERRRRSAEEFFSGAERALVGIALVFVLGEYLVGVKIGQLIGDIPAPGFGVAWLASVADFIRTYFIFAGLTDIALGFCLMMGLRLEENFNKPWLARNLVEFWSRWHMTLSFWCRDYVYTPVAVWLRSPLMGIFCAMFALGLWHETSVYYILWGFYQAAGIALSHLLRRMKILAPGVVLPEALKATLQPLAVLAWVSSARPVITAIIGGSAS
jgi:alginate O-acetyltransferase complex protein AlgI